MFGLFRRRRANGAATREALAPPMSADLRSARDREFAERLQLRLNEKNAAGGKVEPIFKTSDAVKARPPSAATAPRPSTPNAAAAKREAKAPPRPAEAPAEAPRFRDIKLDGIQDPAPAAAAEPAPPRPRLVETVPPERPAATPQELPTLPLIMRAAQFAAERHKTQRRRGAAREPYVNHLLEVANLLATATDGRDPDLVIAGLLHDLIEDQGISSDDIARQFGIGVAALVLEVTTDKTLSEVERNRVQIVHAAHKSPRARMLRIADLTSNLRALRQSPPTDWSVERQRDYFRWAHDVVAGSRGLSPHLDAAFDEAFSTGLPAADSPAPSL